MTLPQGELGVLETETAQRLLASTINARLAYTGLDGMPSALRSLPDVAVMIDTEGFPADVLLLRGSATVTDVDGWVPEYRQAARRHLGEEGAENFVSQFDGRPIRMHRIGLRPSWVGMLDFQTRFPGVLGGIQSGIQ